MAPVARQPSIFSSMMKEPVFNEGSDSCFIDGKKLKDKVWTFEEFWDATGCSKEVTQEAMAMDIDGIEGGGGGCDLWQQGSSSMFQSQSQGTTNDEVSVKINEGLAEAHLQSQRLSATQLQMRTNEVVTDGQHVTLENFLRKTEFGQGALTCKEFEAVEMAHGPQNPMQQIMHHDLMTSTIGMVNGSNPMVGHGMLFLDGLPHMALMPLPHDAQTGATVTVASTSNKMTAFRQANLIHTIGSTEMVRSSTRRCRVHKKESVSNNMEWRKKNMIKNRESAARSRAKKKAYIMGLEAELMYLKAENKRLKADELATEKAMKMVEEMNSKKSGHAMHRRRNSCMW
ncbi:hypothetical protein ACP70R_015598 [Stipagrostis hirtigluma subsp. patula]